MHVIEIKIFMTELHIVLAFMIVDVYYLYVYNKLIVKISHDFLFMYR